MNWRDWSESPHDELKQLIWDAESRIIGVILLVGTFGFWWWLGLFLLFFPLIIRVFKISLILWVSSRKLKQEKAANG